MPTITVPAIRLAHTPLRGTLQTRLPGVPAVKAGFLIAAGRVRMAPLTLPEVPLAVGPAPTLQLYGRMTSPPVMMLGPMPLAAPTSVSYVGRSLPPVDSYASAFAQQVVTGDWLVQAPSAGIKMSIDYNPDGSWEHRLLDISPIEINVQPGGGLATVANVGVRIAENHTGQSIQNLLNTYPGMAGSVITIDFLLRNFPVPLRVFTGKIDSIMMENAVTELQCVDDSIQQDLQIPQQLVTSNAFPDATSAAYAQPEPMIYGAGSNIGAAPFLLVDLPTNTYLVAGHQMHLGGGLAVWDQATTTFLPVSGVVLLSNDVSALLTFGTLDYPPATFSYVTALNVAGPEQGIDGNPNTLAIVGTGSVNSTLDGYGVLTVASRGAGTPQTPIIQITLTNHRRSPGSSPTTTGTFFVQTLDPESLATLRTLYTSPAYNHALSAQTDLITLTNVTIGGNEVLAVRLLAQNAGGPGGPAATYEVGEISAIGVTLYDAPSNSLTALTLPVNTQEIRFNTIEYALVRDDTRSDVFVIGPGRATDGNSATCAVIPTTGLDSNLDGLGRLTLLTPAMPTQRGNNTVTVDFTNHHRSLQSLPTVTGMFILETIQPTTNQPLRENLFVSPQYRQQLTPIATSYTTTGINLGAHEQLAVRILARNEGGSGSMSFTSTTTVTITPTNSSIFTPDLVIGTGSFGAGPGEFNAPYGIAVASNGNIYVADTGNSRVQILTSAGVFVSTLGNSGIGPGQFLLPFGIAFASTGALYVADAGNNRVQKFSGGAFVLAFGSGTFTAVRGIAVDHEGDVWTTDVGAGKQVQRWTSTGTLISSFGASGRGAGQFISAWGIAIDGDDRVYVVDQAFDRLQQFESNGQLDNIYKATGQSPGQLTAPAGIAADPDSNTMWVVDTGNQRVQRFQHINVSAPGIATFGGFGTTASQFNIPWGIAVDSAGGLFITDVAMGRIQHISVQTIVSYLSTTTVTRAGSLDTYEVGEVTVRSFYQPAGDNLPAFLYGPNWFGRYDPTGAVVSYAGLPSNTTLTTPDEVIADIITRELGRAINPTAFAEAYTYYVANGVTIDGGIGAGWAVNRAPARTILNDLAYQAGAMLAPAFDGRWRLVPIQETPSLATFGPHNILTADGSSVAGASDLRDSMQIKLGDLRLVHNSYQINYAYNAGSRTYGKTILLDEHGSTIPAENENKLGLEQICQRSAALHGVLQQLVVNAYWLADDTSAIALLRTLALYFAPQRVFVAFDSTMYAATLQIGERVTVTHPLLFDGVDGQAFEIHTLRYLPMSGRVQLAASRSFETLLTFEYFALKNQDGVVWFYYFNEIQELARSPFAGVPPDIPLYEGVDITGAFVPYWHQVLDANGVTWYLFPDELGVIGIAAASPPIGPGVFTGLGKIARALNNVLMQLGATTDGEVNVSPAAGGTIHARLYAASFTDQTVLFIPGTTHALGTADIVVVVWDSEVPHQLLPDLSVSIDPLTFDIAVSFVTPQSGRILLISFEGLATYPLTFTNQTAVALPGATHLLGTADLGVAVWDNSVPRQLLPSVDATIDASLFDVNISFVTTQSGRLLLFGFTGLPSYATNFTSQLTVTITGGAHGFGTVDFGVVIWDNGTSRQLLTGVSVTVDPSTYDVVVTFVVPQSGRIILFKP